mgnify:CR=1 FL=1
MTIAEAKQLRIVDYLASLGYHPQSVTSKQYWYLSPHAMSVPVVQGQ